MGIEDLDLDLEFETEDELSESNQELVNDDLDLTFGAPGANKKPRSVPVPKKSSLDTNKVTPIKPGVIEKNSQSLDEIKQELAQLKAQLAQVQNEAALKVAVAEAEKNYLIEYISNAKVLDVQITQELKKIHAKAPALKADVQGIKKLLNDFLIKVKR